MTDDRNTDPTPEPEPVTLEPVTPDADEAEAVTVARPVKVRALDGSIVVVLATDPED